MMGKAHHRVGHNILYFYLVIDLFLVVKIV
jgi:hypothetical protein